MIRAVNHHRFTGKGTTLQSIEDGAGQAVHVFTQAIISRPGVPRLAFGDFRVETMHATVPPHLFRQLRLIDNRRRHFRVMDVKFFPLAALAGVLIVTAARMVDATNARAILRSTRSDALVFVLTAVVTVAFDLILAGEPSVADALEALLDELGEFGGI